MKFSLYNLGFALLISQVLAYPEDKTSEFEEKDFIPTETQTRTSSTTYIKATNTTKKTSTKNYRDNMTCTNYNMEPFSSKCSKRSGTVKYTTFGYNCSESVRCIYDGTTVSFNNDNYSFPTTTTDYHDHMTCSGFDIKPFRTECSERSGTVTYSTFGYNCSASIRCLYDGTTVSFNNNKYTFPPTTTTGITEYFSPYSTSTKKDSTSTPISTNGHCGGKDGICPSGQCCSKYGYCGTSEKHCSVEKGCQSAFGKCNNKNQSKSNLTTTTTTTTKKTKSSTPTNNSKISTNGKCGSEDGKCPSGECCSKYGWCGKSSSYCGSGCQKAFGKCK